MSDVSQCPRCELRFPNRVELESHLAIDHPGAVGGDDDVDDDTQGQRDDGPASSRPRPTGPSKP